MKIAIPSTTPDLQGMVEHRLGMAAFMLVIETDDMTFEAMEGPPPSSAPGAGIHAITVVLNMGAEVLLVDFISPNIANVLQSKGIVVIDQVRGCLADAVAGYIQAQATPSGVEEIIQQQEQALPLTTWGEALRKGGRQFSSLLPILLGVVLLLGLFQGFISQDTLLSLFSGTNLQDCFLGALLGSLMAGNPINSYVIGDSLLNTGVGLAPVTALLLTWVGVGILQLPAEAASLGYRFSLVRNLVGFVVAVILSLFMAFFMGVVG